MFGRQLTGSSKQEGKEGDEGSKDKKSKKKKKVHLKDGISLPLDESRTQISSMAFGSVFCSPVGTWIEIVD